ILDGEAGQYMKSGIDAGATVYAGGDYTFQAKTIGSAEAKFFDPTASGTIDYANDRINFSSPHELENRQKVYYRPGPDGTAIGGLSPNTTGTFNNAYWVYRVDADTIELYATEQQVINRMTNGSTAGRINLTNNSPTGTQHSLEASIVTETGPWDETDGWGTTTTYSEETEVLGSKQLFINS